LTEEGTGEALTRKQEPFRGAFRENEKGNLNHCADRVRPDGKKCQGVPARGKTGVVKKPVRQGGGKKVYGGQQIKRKEPGSLGPAVVQGTER